MEEEAAREKLTELDDLGFAFLSQVFIEHFYVPWIFLDAIGNQWGTKEFITSSCMKSSGAALGKNLSSGQWFSACGEAARCFRLSHWGTW